MITTYRQANPRTVHYGENALELLQSELEMVGASRAHVVTTRSVSASPAMQRLRFASPEMRGATFSTVSSHVPISDILRAGMAAAGAEADVVIGLGGGSAMDAAKLVALTVPLLGTGTKPTIEELKRALGDPTLTAALPVLSIPTTLSVAEQYGDAGYTDDESGHKVGIANHAMTSRAVFYDPLISDTTPRRLWASTGIRALDHAVETVMSPDADAISLALSSSAIIDLLAVLPRFEKDVGNASDRLSAYLGAWKGYSNPAVGAGGLSHVLGRLTGAKYGIPHGETSCVYLPLVVQHVYAAERRFADRLNEIESQLESATGFTQSLAQRIARLVARLGLPTAFSSERFTVDARADVSRRAAAHRDASPDILKTILVATVG